MLGGLCERRSSLFTRKKFNNFAFQTKRYGIGGLDVRVESGRPRAQIPLSYVFIVVVVFVFSHYAESF